MILFTLAFFIAVGILASISDIKTHKISNWLIFSSALLIICEHILFWNAFSPPQPSFGVEFYRMALFHLGLCSLSALVLWYYRIWPAGDAKFFVIMGLFLVTLRPHIAGFPNWLFLKFLTNIFIPASIFIVTIHIVEWVPSVRRAIPRLTLRSVRDGGAHLFRQKKAEFQWTNLQYGLFLAWNVIAFVVFSEYVLVMIPANFQGLLRLLFYFLLFVAWNKAPQFLRQSFLSIGMLLLIIVLGKILHRNVLHAIGTATVSALTFLILFSLVRFVLNLLDLGQIVSCHIGQLKQGDVLSHGSWQYVVQTCKKADPGFLLTRYADGLSSEEVCFIQKCFSSELDKSLQVFQTRPFAPWIFIGALWTLYAHDTVLRWPFAVMGLRK